jgi:hypothetical protein
MSDTLFTQVTTPPRTSSSSSGEFSEERRDAQFEVLKEAQGRALDLTYWHDFLKVVRQAGYLGGQQLTSKNNLIYSSILYLMGRTKYKVPEHTLRRAVARYVMCSNEGGYKCGLCDARTKRLRPASRP